MIALLLAWVGVASGSSLLIDGTAAIVGKRLITVREAYFFHAVQEFREGRTQTLPPTGEALRKVVQKLIFEEMLSLEMKNFKFEEGKRSDAERLVRAARQRAPAAWRRLADHYAKTEAQVVDCVFRTLQVERFLQRKIETLTPVVTPAEVDKYLADNKGRLQVKDLDAIRPKIVILLKKEGTQRGLEEWIRALKDKYAAASLVAP